MREYKTKRYAKISGRLFFGFLVWMFLTILQLFTLFRVNDGISAFLSIILLSVTIFYLWALIEDTKVYEEKILIKRVEKV